jgi:hypothetical protein
MNGFRFSNFSSDASFPNNPEVWEILADPIKRNIWIGEYWFEVIKQTSQPHIPVIRIHSGTCPSCGGIVPPSASRCGFCGRYFE